VKDDDTINIKIKDDFGDDPAGDTVVVEDELKKGADATVDGVKKGAHATKEGATKVVGKVKDAVRDDN
jgi:hypothetical protein